MPRMPVLFVGHGSPMNAIEDNAWSRDWRRLGRDLPRPRAILMVSAHWETRGASAVGASATPETKKPRARRFFLEEIDVSDVFTLPVGDIL